MAKMSEVAELAEQGDFERVKEWIQKHTDSALKVALCAKEVLGKKNVPQGLVDLICNRFVRFRQDMPQRHGLWVVDQHVFLEHLWRGRQDQWLRKFYQIAISKAIQFSDLRGLDKLADAFMEFADWCHDPVDFRLTFDTLVYFPDGGSRGYIRERIRVGAFENEVDFLIWRFQNPYVRYHDPKPKEYFGLVSFDRMVAIIYRLAELGCDTKGFEAELADMLTIQLQEFDQLGLVFKLPQAAIAYTGQVWGCTHKQLDTLQALRACLAIP